MKVCGCGREKYWGGIAQGERPRRDDWLCGKTRDDGKSE